MVDSVSLCVTVLSLSVPPETVQRSLAVEPPHVSLSSQSEKPAETTPEPGSAETGPSENKNPSEEPAASAGDQRVQVDSETRDGRTNDSEFEEISSLEVRRTERPDRGPQNPTKESRKSPAGKVRVNTDQNL